MRFRELLEGQNYEMMFTSFVDLTHQGDYVRRQLAEVRRFLKKDDRIVWFLRLFRIGLLARFEESWRQKLPSDIDETGLGKLSNVLKSYVFQYSQPSGLPTAAVMEGGIELAARPRWWLSQLEHFLSLPIPEIQTHVFKYDNPMTLMNTFRAYEKKWQDSRQGLIPQQEAEEGAQVVLRFPNGYAWWLLDKAYCPLEAKAMGHCGNQPRAGSTDKILSLRKAEKRGKQTFYVPYATFILHDGGKLGEMKGRFNSSPKNAFEEGYAPSDFHDEIFALLKLPMIKVIIGGGYMPEENFKVADLPPEQIEALGEVKPQMLPLKMQFKKHGLTPTLVEQIIAQGGDDIKFDTANKAFIWDERANLKDFIEKYVKVDRNHRNAVALWILDVLEGDHQDFESHNAEDSQKQDLLDDLKRIRPKEYAKLVAHIEELWDAEHDDFDADEEDRPELLEMIQEVNNELDEALMIAISDGLQRGAENEMSKTFDKWLDDLKTPDDFWITLPQWNKKYYDSACNVMVKTEVLIDMIEKGEEEPETPFEPDDISEPHYGFSGYDEKAALEYLLDNLPNMADAS